jgi:Lar family restriction alleviation protein
MVKGFNSVPLRPVPIGGSFDGRMNAMAIKLKRCPFCGGKARLSFSIVSGAHFVLCSKCDSNGKLMYPDKSDVKELLAEHWNTRVIDEKNAELAARYRGLCK